MNVLETSQLYKTYDNGVEAVRGLDLQIHQGEVFGFLGPNGAGKTTTISMITGLTKATTGTIKILGKLMPDEAEELIPEMGYIPQELIFYNHLTIKENLELFSSCYEIENTQDNIDRVLRLLKISDLVDRKSSDLSGGQKRRLNLAIGLLHQPKILLLDEPSAGMDPQSRNALWEAIEDISKDDITIILTTHLMETADRLSDRIAIIDHGKITAIDTPANLKAKYGSGDMIVFSFSDLDSINIDQLQGEMERQYDAEVVIRNNSARLQVKDGLAQVSDVIKSVELLVSKNQITGISVQENTLEDVFIAITGRELR